MIPVILGVIVIVFFFQAVSKDDPVMQILGPGATEEMVEAKRDELGLNDPIVVQFGRYVWNFVAHGDLGTSYQTKRDVSEEIWARLPYTVGIAVVTIVLASIIGIILGTLSAVKQYTAVDSLVLVFATVCTSMPNFWLALMAIYLFSVKLGWVPASGISNPKGWILPISIVTLQSCSNIIRITRSSMLETIRQDYIRTVRAKGQKEGVVIRQHVLRNSLIPIIAAIGNVLGLQLGGALIVESVFGIPGIGMYAVDAINARDYPAVLGSVVVLAIVYTIVNLIVDIAYTFADSRLKTSFAASAAKQVRKKAKNAEGV